MKPLTQDRMYYFLDMKSVSLFTATVWLGLISLPDTLSGWVTLVAGLTTIIYNAYRFFRLKYPKKNQNE